jgi:hypothetical protein
MLTRVQSVQGFLDLYANPSYLEIGVNKGDTFHGVRARRKVAVDPRFLFNERAGSDDSVIVQYHEVTSDTYFGTIASQNDRFDLIYIDGLHTFEQTLRDLLNSTSFLSPTGILLIDDVIPNSYEAAIPDMGTARAVLAFVHRDDPSWMGDVFKLVFFVQTFMQQYSYATITENHGQLVMWRAPRPRVISRRIVEFGHLEFSDVVVQQEVFCRKTYIEILQQIKATLARHDREVAGRHSRGS